jgi:DNA-directed RNA polymerase specialized sigma24 family protein
LLDELSFREWIGHVRAGDEEAATELVRQYAPVLEKAVRRRLLRRRLHRVLEAPDVSQAVLARFFCQARAGRFCLERPEQVRKLLLRMARNQVSDEARHHRARRRDLTRLEDGFSQEGLELLEDTAPAPVAVVAWRELVVELFRRLSDDERELAEQRAEGRAWASLAAQRGSTPDALRKQLARAVDRAGRGLGLGSPAPA